MTGTSNAARAAAAWLLLAAAVSARADDEPVILTLSLPDGRVGTDYSAPLEAAGGDRPYRWSITMGDLPDGLSLNDRGGTIRGIPGRAGTFVFTVRVRDDDGETASRRLSITIASATPVAITTAALPAGVVGRRYTQQLAAVGGEGGYQWSIASGSLPPGLALDSGQGLIDGVPTAAGSFTFFVRVTDSIDGSGTRELTIQILPPLAVATGSLPQGVVGTAYSHVLTATGGFPPYSWTIAGGSLPPGLALSGAAIAGTPAAAGTFAFTVQVSDGQASAARQLSITVRVPPLEVATASLPPGTVGAPYSQALAATGGTPPYTWSVNGSLPPGLALSGAAIAGTPAAAGTFVFTVQVSDGQASAARQLAITVAAPPLEVTTASLASGTVGAPYSQSLAATGGTPPYAWSVNGSLPPGLALSGAAIAGTPRAAGTFVFTVQVSDGQASAARQLSITVDAPPLAVTTVSLASGTVGVPYSQDLAAAGGTPPYTWTVHGTLPPGLVLSGSSITGTPSAPGTFVLTVEVSDGRASAVRQLGIAIDPPPLEITTTSLPAGSVGAQYFERLTVRGGTPPYAWSVDGSLPPGLALSGLVIAGTPSAPGTFDFTVEVSDGRVSASRRLSITIHAPALEITTASLPAGTVGAPYSQELAAAGGAPPYRWTVEGSLPPGVALSGATIAGTPGAPGAFAFTVQVSDGQATATRQLSITVNLPALEITTASLPAGTVGVPYSQTLAAKGGVPPYTWTVEGSLPPGLALSGSTIAGTPVTPGTSLFTVQVTDGQSTAARQLSITIHAAPLEVMTASLPAGAVGTPYSQILAARGGAPPYAWSAAGPLPPGLALDAAGAIGGTPVSAGGFTFTLQVADASGATATRELTLAVSAVGMPAVSITGGAGEIGPLEQPAVGVALAAPYPAPLTGELILTFEPDAAVPVDDPAVQFVTGGRRAAFTIAANATAATFALPAMAFQTGTVAGTITLRLTLRAGERDFTPAGGAARAMRIPRTGPSIRSASAARTPAGFEVRLVGLAPGRELENAAVRLTPAPASDLQTVELTVPLGSAAASWYGNPAAAQFGSQFSLLLPFTVQGNAGSIAAVTVTLTNRSGASEAVELPLL